MKSIMSVILVVLLAWSSTCQSFGYSIVGPLSSYAFTCLNQRQIADKDKFYVIVRIYKVSGTPGVDPNGAQTTANIDQGLGGASMFYVNGYIQVCRGLDAATQMTTLSQQISLSNYNVIWLKVLSNTTITNPECAWDGYTQQENCNYLIEMFNALNTLQNTQIGIFSTAPLWQYYFGGSCDYFGQSENIPLWYANYHSDTGLVDSTQSYDDFVPFGGWYIPSLKQVGGNVTVALCYDINGGVYITGFVDQVWTAYIY